MVYDCGSCLAKYVLCGFNFIIFVAIQSETSSMSLVYSSTTDHERSLYPLTYVYSAWYPSRLATAVCSMTYGILMLETGLCLVRNRQLAGSSVLAVGIWLAVDKNSFIGLSKIVPNEQVQSFTQPGVIEQISYIFIAVGALMFLVSFLGYCGALRESQCMLTTYGILLLTILILEITAVCLAVIYKSKAEEETKNILKSTLSKYYSQSENGDAITLAWDSLQMNLHCCGVDNYTDYQRNDAWARGDKIIPESCCVLDATMKPLASSCTSSPTDVNSYYMMGCFKAVMNWILTHLDIIIGIAIGLGVVEILGIFLAFCLAKSINGYK